ncbi:hypothetical protein GH714_010806 [Hevea brasiliensis]|uniref:SREBP regulating gene protein n=1 Tax=Hevea brasiliensis TaxID=3981 RepID=A0A6A6LJE8_HEVBR|nr:hypothetical protein GH714_010806 [Hevea brasiliensis]
MAMMVEVVGFVTCAVIFRHERTRRSRPRADLPDFLVGEREALIYRFDFPGKTSVIDVKEKDARFCHVCDALSVDPRSRCCPEKGEKFSCHGCNLLSQCCNSYEFCVSCCLNPARTQEEEVIKLKIAKPTTAGTYAGIFDFCAGRCRHNSESVVHENAYLSDFHHCYSLSSNSSGANYTEQEARLVGINVVIGRQGESCHSACKSNGQSCVLNKLLVLNHCDVIQELACILEHNQRFPVTAHISIPEDFVPAHSVRIFCLDNTLSMVAIRLCMVQVGKYY